MSINPLSYPIVIRVVDGYVEASQPDLQIYRVRGRFEDIKQREEIGAIVLEVWNEVVTRIKADPGSVKKPSKPTEALSVQNGKVVTVPQAAEVLGLSEATVRRMCDSGALDSFKTAGGRRKIKMSDPRISRFFPP